MVLRRKKDHPTNTDIVAMARSVGYMYPVDPEKTLLPFYVRNNPPFQKYEIRPTELQIPRTSPERKGFEREELPFNMTPLFFWSARVFTLNNDHKTNPTQWDHVVHCPLPVDVVGSDYIKRRGLLTPILQIPDNDVPQIVWSCIASLFPSDDPLAPPPPKKAVKKAKKSAAKAEKQAEKKLKTKLKAAERKLKAEARRDKKTVAKQTAMSVVAHDEVDDDFGDLIF